MCEYYRKGLSGARLQRCYELAPPRVRQYLAAEVEFVIQHFDRGAMVLELGCGYGRVLDTLIHKAGHVVGIDTSLDSIALARDRLGGARRCALSVMNAVHLGFRAHQFDTVICIQNGLAVFGLDPAAILSEALRVTRSGGQVLLSSYSDRFWDHRLEWFEIQSEHGLIGEIDRHATRDGTIVCADGFCAKRITPQRFISLAKQHQVACRVVEVDSSSVFCEIAVS